jgi:hypothetical protein
MAARKFFYVCAGLFLLALSYHLGAAGAHAQATGGVECVSYTEGRGIAVVNHRFYEVALTNPPTFMDFGPLPAAARAVACGDHGVVLEDGTVWACLNPNVWQGFGTLPLSGPVPTQQESWGQLKARYAPSHTSTNK